MSFLVTDWIKANTERLRLELAEQLIKQPGELGTARESILREFIARNIPQRFGVDTGFVFDVAGNISKQIDIVIFDKEVCPRFDSAGSKNFFPCEAVVAVGEMKSTVNSKKGLESALDNIRSVKKLDRSGNGSAIDTRFGESIENEHNHLHQIFSFIFVSKNSLKSFQSTKILFEENFNYQRHLWPNAIFSFDKYLLTYACEHGYCPNPMDALAISCFDEIPKDQLLLTFLSTLTKSIIVTRTAYPNYHELYEANKPVLRKHMEFIDAPIKNSLPQHLLKRPKGYY